MRKNIRIQLFVTILVLAAAFFSVPALAADETSPKDSMATVNGFVITRGLFEAELGRIVKDLLNKGMAPTEDQIAELDDAALDNLINRELLYQQSKKLGIPVDMDEVEKRITAVKERFKTPEEYQSALNAMGITEDEFKEFLLKDLAVRNLIQQEYEAKTQVTDQELEEYYKAHPEQFTRPEQVRARHILIMVKPDATEEQKAEAKKKAEEIREKALAGEDFAALATEYSEGPTKEKGGDLGFFGRGQTVKPFEEAAFALEPGGLSEVVLTQFGYHIIKLEEKRPEELTPLADVKDKMAAYFKQQKVQEAIAAYLAEAKKTADIKKTAAVETKEEQEE